MATRFQTSMKTDHCTTLKLINIATLAPVSVDHQLAAGCRLENLSLAIHTLNYHSSTICVPGGLGKWFDARITFAGC